MNQVVLITSGVGPLEARQFVARLARWMEGRCERAGHPVDGDIRHGPRDALYSERLEVRGDAMTRLAGEIGTHVLVARSPHRGRRARKRWFSAVSIFPAEECSVRSAPVIRPSELEMTAVRSRGPGGQHVNRTATAVRLLHVPSGISVRVESERSQSMNRRKAELMIRKTLVMGAQERQAVEIARRRQRHHSLERGVSVRVHILDRNGELEDLNEQ